MANRKEKLIRLADIIDDAKELFNNFFSGDESEKPDFDVNSAVLYNSKLKQMFAQNEAIIKKNLNTTYNWESPEFAEAVYKWQKDNGITGKLVDGKFGPITMAAMSKIDPTLINNTDTKTVKTKSNDKPYPRVIGLLDKVKAARQRLGATDIPLNLLMGWIQVESGGRLNDITNVKGGPGKEMGLFQISESEANAIGADHDKLTSDVEYSIEQGIKLARYHESNLAATITKYYPKGSDMYWRMILQGFIAGDGFVKQLLNKLSASGFMPPSWEGILQFAQKVPYIAGHSTVKWTNHLDKAFDMGDKIVQKINVATFNSNQRIKDAVKQARILAMLGLIE